MSEKETVMVLKLLVDLQCSCCYKKVKKILCKFPEIRDQKYEEKANTVTIRVVCCNLEKIRDKLCCKGSKVIKSIEIKKPVLKKKDDLKPGPVVRPIPVATDKEGPGYPPRTCCEGYGRGPCYHGFGYYPYPYPPRPCYCEHRCGYYNHCYFEECPQSCSIM